MKRKSTKKSKSASSRGRSAGKSRSGMKMGARSSARSSVRASGAKSAAKSGSRSKKSGAKTRASVSAKSNPRVTTRAKSGSARKSPMRARAGGAISKAVNTLKGAVTSLKGRSPLKSTSDVAAKRGASRASTRGNRLERGELNTRSGGISGARSARMKQPMGTNRPVNASTKPSVGKLPISDIQHAPIDERLSPQSDKPYTGADAFKPNAKGSDTLMSAPPRKPIRQSRNQVGVRHH